ncbi:MAG: hypothetical protein IKB77_02290 [Lentisphaeria bacterium]|nr:hypothetical protein [Lentisphaeria bacterium]
MKKLRKTHVVLVVISLLILAGSVGITVFLLFSNYQNISLFKQAQSNFARGDDRSLDLAEAQLLQLIRNDDDNENAYIMLAAIAGKRKVYPEQVYYSFMAHKLNPLSEENKAEYIKSLLFAREFERLENFLSHQYDLTDEQNQFLLYSAGQNGNINKYKAQYQADKTLNCLTFLLFKDKKSADSLKLETLAQFKTDDLFLQQEILAAQTGLYLQMNDFDKSEKALQKAYELNPFAFAPALGRFYANFRTFGKALEIFEKYLETYHDLSVAMQTAEIYCLLNSTEKIAALRRQYQSDSGNSAMLGCYYFDALAALAKNDMAALKEFVMPLRKNINTPLAAFMFLAADIYSRDYALAVQSYKNLVSMRPYLDLQSRADDMISAMLKQSLTNGNTSQFVSTAKLLYRRKPDIFTAKYILLSEKNTSAFDAALLRDALKKFPADRGLIKIAVEYYLNTNIIEAKKYINSYGRLFPDSQKDMLRYQIIAATAEKEFDTASWLFKNNFSPEICPAYWDFASNTMREDDLKFLSRNKLYAPFCQALLAMKKGDKKSACKLLAEADAADNWNLLFFAAKTLAENGQNREALAKYALFKKESPYYLAVLLNTAEIHAELGNLKCALSLAKQAYGMSPALPEAQLCYADKLYRNGQLTEIPDVVKLTVNSLYRRRLEFLLIQGLQKCIEIRYGRAYGKQQKEQVRELCRRLLLLDSNNKIAQEHLKKLNKMPQ